MISTRTIALLALLAMTIAFVATPAVARKRVMGLAVGGHSHVHHAHWRASSLRHH